MKSTQLIFSPALACVDCQKLTNRGLISQTGSQEWQLLPRCGTHMEKPNEPISLSTLRCCISEQLAEIEHLQRKQRHIGRAYVRLRRHRAHRKAQRALRMSLNRTYRQLWEQSREVQA